MFKQRVHYFVLLFSSFLLFPTIAHAKKTIDDAPTALNAVAGRVGVEQTTVPLYVGTIIQTILMFSGILFFVLMVYAGFRWMTARGEEEKITKAKRTLIGAIIGLAILVSSYALTNFITTRIIEGTPNVGGDINFENVDFTTLGCCFDKVQHPSGSGLEVRATTWAWRVTSQGDCQEEGERVSSIDAIAGPGLWKFTPVDSKQQCEALYTTFCETEDCYDLGF